MFTHTDEWFLPALSRYCSLIWQWVPTLYLPKVLTTLPTSYVPTMDRYVGIVPKVRSIYMYSG